jgi:hypothetical protein
MAEVSLLNGFYDRTQSYDRSSCSEILIVSDEVSCYYVRSLDWWNGLLRTALFNPQLQLAKIGAPADHILVDDLALIDPNKYKMVVFLNCYNLTDNQRLLINSLKNNNRLLVFCYAPGYFNGSQWSTANIASICGINISISSSENFIQPGVNISTQSTLGTAISNTGYSTFSASSACCKRAWVSDPAATTLGVYPDATNLVSMALKDFGTWTSLYCATAEMPASVLRELARYAGVHIYNEANDTLYANKSYICVHSFIAGTRTIKFLSNVDVYDALTEQVLARNVTSWTWPCQLGETCLLRIGPR